jgi:two-component system, cell cycle sensor histidine kinase and response regulator CckA
VLRYSIVKWTPAPMRHLERSPLYGSVVALALTAVALLISLLLRPYLEPDIFLLFVVVVWMSAWYYGRTIGLVAMGASALAQLVFFFPGAAGFWAVGVRLGAFLATAGVIVWMTAEWRESRRVLASTLAGIGDAVLATDTDGHITFLNPVAEALTGWPDAEARKKAVEDVLRLVDERTRHAIDNPLMRVLRERAMVTTSEHITLISRSGAEVPIEINAAPVRGDSGDLRGAILVFRDTSKRRQFAEQAAHAHKMEAVGRLAGGVAGDFNNMLTVIAGYAELLRGDVSAGSPTRQFVDEIVYAGKRAASLTEHLLAFSRGSAAQPRVLDLDLMLSNMEPMLRRLLGQNIELLLLAAPGLGRIKADPVQIEQVIVNLATNARDAMPNGGKLVVETANVDLEAQAGERLGMKPGPCVMLAVSDNGIGMDVATRSRLFEPFFTTKAPGNGSGLGLSTVYGVVKQAEGQVTVYSQPNCGTIFEVYLPRVTQPVMERVPVRPLVGSETILLVDDEEGVRKLCCAVLQTNGYNVLEAGSGQSALAAYDKNAHKVDMLLTDVVMRQMNGFELGRALSERTPGLKILYMSGYRDNAVEAEPGQAPDRFLQKPFTPDALLAKVREVLDAAVG